MNSSSPEAYQICELPGCFKFPASIPRRFRAQDELGFDSFTAIVGFRDWHLVNDLVLTSNCLWQQIKGRVTFRDLGRVVSLLPGESAFLLPGKYELGFLDPEPQALLSIMPDEPLRRLVRGYDGAHCMVHGSGSRPTSERIFRTSQFGRMDWVPGSHARTVLGDLLQEPVDYRLVDGLAAGPCQSLKNEVPPVLPEEGVGSKPKPYQQLEELWAMRRAQGAGD